MVEACGGIIVYDDNLQTQYVCDLVREYFGDHKVYCAASSSSSALAVSDALCFFATKDKAFWLEPF